MKFWRREDVKVVLIGLAIAQTAKQDLLAHLDTIRPKGNSTKQG
jgi:hypothetical protein